MKPLDFIVIGAGRSGTTWVWTLLRQHPDCFVPLEKELHYFNREAPDPRAISNPNFTNPIEWYEKFFKAARPSQLRGEISPSYLWSTTAAERIRAYNPRVKLVALLRDPVERSFSHHLYRVQRGNDPQISFEEALERHPFILERSLYGQHLTRYLEIFPRQQLKVLFHETLRLDPRQFARDLELFLGLEPFYPMLRSPVNQSGKPVHPYLAKYVTGLTMALQRHPRLWKATDVLRRGPLYRVIRDRRRAIEEFTEKPWMSAETERRLRDHFRSDIERLESLLGTDLSLWKSVRKSSI